MAVLGGDLRLERRVHGERHVWRVHRVQRHLYSTDILVGLALRIYIYAPGWALFAVEAHDSLTYRDMPRKK